MARMAARLGEYETELSSVREQVQTLEEARATRHQLLLEPMKGGLSTAVQTSTYLQIVLITIVMAALEVQDR